MTTRLSLVLCLVSAATVPAIRANYIGGERPPCKECNVAPNSAGGKSGNGISLSEGNLRDSLTLPAFGSGAGEPPDVTLTYNSYNADGSHAQLDTGLGYGWTQTYNSLLFSQAGNFFRMGPDGRTEKFTASGSSYSSDPGYYETMVHNGDGSYTVTTKDQTTYRYALVPGTPFVIGGPVYRLTTIDDRNGNATTLTYTGGNLTQVADTYGRTITFGYNGTGHLTQFADPLGRVTRFGYDSTGRHLSAITDPNGKTISYSYNALGQFTAKEDRDGRTFTYQYQSNLPTGSKDGSGASIYGLSNPSKWGTSSSSLATQGERVYTPATSTLADGRSNPFTYTYDSGAYLTSRVAPDGATTRYTYDPATLRLSSLTDADGNVSRYTYDPEGNRLSVTDALGNVTAYTYDPTFNEITSITDPKSRVTHFNYDSHGNLILVTDPLGQTQSWTYDAHGNVLTATDKRGYATQYVYDAKGDRIKTIDPLGNTTSMGYDAAGNVISRTDANHHTTTYQYDSLNRETVETDPNGNSIRYGYDNEGDRISLTDRDGHVTTYSFDLRHRLVTTTDALGHTATNTYDSNNNLLSATDPNTHTFHFQYDVQNRVIQTTDALGGMTSGVYDPVGNVLSRTDADDHTTQYTYDALDRRTTITDPIGNVTQIYYDTGGSSGCSSCGATPGTSLVTEQIDGNGKVTFFKYDDLDRLTTVVQKVGSTADTITSSDAVTSYTYDPDNDRLTLTQPDGNITQWQYDKDDRVTSTIDAAGDTTTQAYDAVGNEISRVTPDLNATTSTYDALNRLIQVSDSIGICSQSTYDPNGNRLTQVDGDGNTTSFAYDALNRTISFTDPLGRTTTAQYDPVGNAIKTVDRDGNASTATYDALNRRVTAVDALGFETQYQYDAVGNIVKIIDPNGHATQRAYDADNRLKQETTADSQVRSYTYDAVGNRLSRTDQAVQTTTYTYNDLYFLVGRTYPSGVDDTFTYDLSGRTLSAQRGAWVETFTYDGGDRLITSTQNGQNLSFAYNVPGRTRTITYPGGRVVMYTYDYRDRISQIDDASSPPPIAQYSYDMANRVITRTYRNGVTANYSYDADSHLLSVTHSGGSVVSGFSYAYDNEGNRTYEDNLQNSNDSQAYTYDATYRLLGDSAGVLSGSTVPAPLSQATYALDAVGNWNTVTTNGVPQNRTHNSVNELVLEGTTALTYDANGNLVADGVYQYAYDEENRLTKVIRDADSAVVGQYLYDALGRRVQKIANPSGTAVTSQYYYDDVNLLEEQSSPGVTVATNVFGNGIDEVLTRTTATQTYYFHQNALGSVVAASDPTGAAAERYRYDAYGNLTVSDGMGNAVGPNPWGAPHSAIGNPWLFTGRQMDEEAGLYFYRARQFSSAEGRFLQRDPEDAPNGMNQYEYAASRPTFFIDPTGLEGEEVTCFTPISFELTVGGGVALSLQYCTDSCDNWAWTYAPSPRVGLAIGIGGGFMAAEGCLKDWIEGTTFDITASALIVSGGVDYQHEGRQFGGHGGLGYGPLRGGLSGGLNITRVIRGDLCHACPCTEKICARRRAQRMRERLAELERDRAAIARQIEYDNVARLFWDRTSLSTDEQSRLVRTYGLNRADSLDQFRIPGMAFGVYHGPLPMTQQNRCNIQRRSDDLLGQINRLNNLLLENRR